MRSYVLLSSIVFGILTAVQLVRLVLAWPIVIAGASVPVWASAIAALVAGSLAVSGIRLLLADRNRPTSS